MTKARTLADAVKEARALLSHPTPKARLHKPELFKGDYSYKIYNPKLKLFSTGGSRPSWHKKGKTWGGIGHLKNHLRQTDYEKVQFWQSDFYKGCIIMEYILQNTSASSVELVFSPKEK